MTAPLVVEVLRSRFVESTHLVDVAVVNERGSLVACAGDPMRPATFRSSAKPLQARLCREAGWTPRDDRHLAVACSSHSGEPEHVTVVREVLGEAGVAEDALRCPAAVPFHAESALAVSSTARVYHNCSGKHAAMLAACAAAGWPLDGYGAPEHPLQRRIVARMEGLLPAPLRLLVDGCGVPTFVAPLVALARAFGSAATGPEAAAMRAEPFLVGGSGRLDSDVMRVAPHVLAKTGAEGLSCASSGGLGIAVKVRDGGPRARGPALLATLRTLGLIDETAVRALSHHTEVPTLGGDATVGHARATGSLARS